jgi:hypothetical protein
MLRKALVAPALLLVVALPTRGAEFVPGWDVDGLWTSNVFRSDTNEQPDFYLSTGPSVTNHQ